MNEPASASIFDQPAGRAARLFAITPRAAILIAVALLGAAFMLAVQNDRLVRAEKLRQAAVQAQILAESVAAPLAFDDKPATREYLAALRSNPEVKAAGVYNEKGAFVAGFSTAEVSLPAAIHVTPPSISGRDVIVTEQVAQGGTALGSVYLRTSLESWPRRALRYVGIALVVLMASLLIAVLGSSYASLREAHAKLQAEIRTREQAEEALRQSQKMEAMGQLTGGVAHDFNNLLMVASSGLDLMERTSDPAKIERLKNGIRQAVDRGAKLTQQLLTFARRSPLHPEIIDIGQRIYGMDALLDRSLGEHIVVDLRLPSGLWPIEVDPSQFEVALLNITLNARDAMPQGGTIVIDAENVASAGNEPDQVRISVSDSGTGIPADMIAQVFEPFFTTKGVGQGTGLGLSQVYGFARASGGEVRIESEPGRGTTVSLVIPRSQKLPAIPERAAATTPAAVKQQCILLVEDDDHVAEMITEMLVALGYESERAVSADAAMVRLEQSISFDLVLSDMVMPGKRNGMDLVREINARWPKVPTLLMTGYSAAAASASNDNIRLLLKPFAIEDLSAQLEAASAEKQPG